MSKKRELLRESYAEVKAIEDFKNKNHCENVNALDLRRNEINTFEYCQLLSIGDVFGVSFNSNTGKVKESIINEIKAMKLPYTVIIIDSTKNEEMFQQLENENTIIVMNQYDNVIDSINSKIEELELEKV